MSCSHSLPSLVRLGRHMLGETYPEPVPRSAILINPLFGIEEGVKLPSDSAK
jgi:hypothetical protein